MEHSVCFIGHRKINDTPELRERLQSILLDLIENGTVNFIFGDHSAFDDFCYDLVTELKEKYPEIKRINFRKDYEDTDDYTMQFLIKGYEESIVLFYKYDFNFGMIRVREFFCIRFSVRNNHLLQKITVRNPFEITIILI